MIYNDIFFLEHFCICYINILYNIGSCISNLAATSKNNNFGICCCLILNYSLFYKPSITQQYFNCVMKVSENSEKIVQS
jgi:hypothetical protein